MESLPWRLGAIFDGGCILLEKGGAHACGGAHLEEKRRIKLRKGAS
jgi:hypothetical protein